MDYLRVPVTDEKAPKPDDFGVLIGRAWGPPPGAALVFNCQMGRGRTTTGMIIASLLHLQALARPPNSAGEAVSCCELSCGSGHASKVVAGQGGSGA